MALLEEADIRLPSELLALPDELRFILGEDAFFFD
jgi:hypothetical protein